MISNKPYLIRAIYEWIIDNKLTPYIVINAEVDGVQVPTDHIKDNNIVLDISPEACIGLHLDNDRIVFSASFSGVSTQIFTPPDAVVAIYAKENGEGMVFSFDKAVGSDSESGIVGSSSESGTNIHTDAAALVKDKKIPDIHAATSKKLTKKSNRKTTLKVVK